MPKRNGQPGAPGGSIIASRSYDVRQRDGSTTTATIQFLQPEQVCIGEWKCGVIIEGLSGFTRPAWPRGVDAFQALLLAFWFAEAALLGSEEHRSRRLTYLGSRKLFLVKDMVPMLAKLPAGRHAPKRKRRQVPSRRAGR